MSTRNSLARAAAALTLHPNAVNYRIRRIEQTLNLDLDDPTPASRSSSPAASGW